MDRFHLLPLLAPTWNTSGGGHRGEEDGPLLGFGKLPVCKRKQNTVTDSRPTPAATRPSRRGVLFPNRLRRTAGVMWARAGTRRARRRHSSAHETSPKASSWHSRPLSFGFRRLSILIFHDSLCASLAVTLDHLLFPQTLSPTPCHLRTPQGRCPQVSSNMNHGEAQAACRNPSALSSLQWPGGVSMELLRKPDRQGTGSPRLSASQCGAYGAGSSCCLHGLPECHVLDFRNAGYLRPRQKSLLKQ